MSLDEREGGAADVVEGSGPGDARHGRAPSVLLVDDHPENLIALEAVLEPLGVPLVRAASAEEALRAVLAQDFAVILLDVQMPGTDGLETARLIKTRDASRVTPIIFLTALDHDRRHVTEGYESGAVDYLFKPIDADVLRAKVAAFVGLYERREQEVLRQRRRYADLSAQSERALREAGQMSEERLRAAYEAERRARAEADEARLAAEGARQAAERSAARTRRLQEVTAALAGALAAGEVATIVVEQGVAALSADAGSIVRIADDGASLEVVRAVGYPNAAVERWQRLPIDAPFPLAEAARAQHPVFLESAEEWRARYASAATPDMLADNRAWAALPLAVDGRALGAMGLSFAQSHVFDPDVRAFMLALAQQCALALERAQLYAAAERARHEAEEANRAKSQFLATMSHEIRTPINAALGYAELLALGLAGPVTEQQQDYLGRLRTSSQHLLGLINEVLDLSKAEAGQMTVVREPAMTGGAVGAAVTITLPLADGKGIRLVDQGAGEPGIPYVGDEQRVRQIVVNLLSNAVKFTPPGGSVTVTCDTAAEAPASPHLSGRGPWAVIRVEDTGMGIAAGEQERVFEPFVQAEAGLTRTAGGTGLGLTISRRLARLMGGELTVQSRAGAGSTFTLWLPAGAPAEAPAGSQPLRVEPPRPEGLAAVGAFLRERLERVLEDYVERLRHEPALPPDVREMPTAKLEDHGITFLGDLAQCLVAIEETGGLHSDILRDGTAIQRFISELHGQQRHRLGWTEAQLARDYDHMTAALEAMVRRRVPDGAAPGGGPEIETAVRVLRQLIGVAAAAAHRAFRHASQTAAP